MPTSELLLLSGGLDSTALAALARPARCLTVDYGQKAALAEIAASRKICQELALSHDVLPVPIPGLGIGDMADSPGNDLSPHSEFWPFRNQFLITVAAMYAAKYGFQTILIGSVATDKRHKDGSIEFIEKINSTVKMQEGAISIVAPSITKTTYELIQDSNISMPTLAWAHSCHTANIACGYCKGCQKHTEIMRQLGWVR